MQLDVTTTPARLAIPRGSVAVLQNMGAGAVYVDSEDTVSADTSFELGVDAVYEFPNGEDNSIWVVSDATADLRILLV
jgi:hypothetical protein